MLGKLAEDAALISEFVAERGSRDRRERATFDWESGIVSLHEDKTAALMLPTFDPLSLMWQYYFAPPTTGEENISVWVTWLVWAMTGVFQMLRRARDAPLAPAGGAAGVALPSVAPVAAAGAGVGGRVAELAHRTRLDLADALAGEVEVLADLFERAGLAPVESEPQSQDLTLALVERSEQLLDLVGEHRLRQGLRRPPDHALDAAEDALGARARQIDEAGKRQASGIDMVEHHRNERLHRKAAEGRIHHARRDHTGTR